MDSLLDKIKEAAEDVVADAYEIKQDFLESKDYDRMVPRYGSEYLDGIADCAFQEIVYDAQAVRAQIEDFRIALQNNHKIAKPGKREFIFFREIWSGDTYGVGGKEGLEQLLLELEKQREELEYEVFMTELRKKLGIENNQK